MTVDQITRYRDMRPFMPFLLHVADGSIVPVDHPELLFLNGVGLTITVQLRDRSVRVIDVMTITQIEMPAPSDSHPPAE